MHAPWGPEQIAAVAGKFPALRAVFEGPWQIVWHGQLVGFEQAYEVRIVWTRWSPCDKFEIETHAPRVYVLCPKLEPRSATEPIEHLYRRSPVHGIQAPPDLCLFDPGADEWDERHLIADTIIPWACDWLCADELWRVTGIWHAPNRHPDIGKLYLLSKEVAASASPALITLVERRIGSSVSLPLTFAAAAGKFGWFSRSDWYGSLYQPALDQPRRDPDAVAAPPARLAVRNAA